MFSVIYTVLLRPLPFPDAQRIVFIWDTDPNRNVVRGVASPAEFLDWRDQNHSFEEISAWRTWFYNLTGTTRTRAGLRRPRFPANFLHLLGVTPLLGRDFIPEEDQVGHDQVAIITYGLWQRRFGSDRHNRRQEYLAR